MNELYTRKKIRKIVKSKSYAKENGMNLILFNKKVAYIRHDEIGREISFTKTRIRGN